MKELIAQAFSVIVDPKEDPRNLDLLKRALVIEQANDFVKSNMTENGGRVTNIKEYKELIEIINKQYGITNT